MPGISHKAVIHTSTPMGTPTNIAEVAGVVDLTDQDDDLYTIDPGTGTASTITIPDHLLGKTITFMRHAGEAVSIDKAVGYTANALDCPLDHDADIWAFKALAVLGIVEQNRSNNS